MQFDERYAFNQNETKQNIVNKVIYAILFKPFNYPRKNSL